MAEPIKELSATQRSLGFEEMLKIMSEELQIEIGQVRNTVYLLDDEKTIAFIVSLFNSLKD